MVSALQNTQFSMFFHAKAKHGMEETVEPANSELKYYVEGIGISIIGLVGLVTNIIALYILFNRKVFFLLNIILCKKLVK